MSKPSLRKTNSKTTTAITLDATTGAEISTAPTTGLARTVVAEDIIEAYQAAEKALIHAQRKVLICGLLMIEQKARVKHGEFGPWLQENCPQIPRRTAQQWMALADGMLSHLELAPDTQVDGFPLLHVLQLESTFLSAPARKIQEKVFNLVDGKSQKQLLLEFRDPEPEPTGGYRPASDIVAKWISKNHPEHEGKTFKDLPKAIQKEFQATTKARELNPADQYEADRAANVDLWQMGMAGIKILSDGNVADYLTRDEKQQLIDACVEVANFYRERLRDRSKADSKAGRNGR